MGLKDMLQSTVSSVTRAGEVNGAEFPVGTYLNICEEDGDGYLRFTYPNKTEEKITHDMIKCATVLSTGVIDIQSADRGKGLLNNVNKTGIIVGNATLYYGTKYLCVLKDGRQAVLTVGLGRLLYRVEHVLF